MTQPELPPPLIRLGWQWHPHIPSALIRETKQGREVKDTGDAAATVAAAMRTVPKRGRPPKKRSA